VATVTPRRGAAFSVALTATLAAVGWLFAGAALASPPAIVFASETCDLGSIVQGEQPACEFPFANGGTEELRVLRLEPSCGCTTALLTSRVMQAGERGTLRVVFDSANFAGDVVKEVEVGTNDPARATVTLRVKALVEPEIDFEPRLVTFEDVRAGETRTQTVMLTNRRAEAVRVVRLEAQPSSCACALAGWPDASQPLVLESWDRVRVEARFDSPQAVTMPIAGECVFVIEGPRKREFRLKIFALPSH
jgi:hypothetical protein